MTEAGNSQGEEVAMSRTRNDRLQVRLDSASKAVLERAAGYSRKSISQFVLETSLERADDVIREHESVTLSHADWDRFQAALIDPPEPNAALKRAFARYQKSGE